MAQYHKMDPRNAPPMPSKTTEPYMNGRGVMQRTRELSDDVWAKLDGALYGSFIGIPAIVISAFGVLFSWNFGRSPNFLSVAIFAFVGIIGAVVWHEMNRPWSRAMAALVAHRKALEAETAKRGKGWSKS